MANGYVIIGNDDHAVNFKRVAAVAEDANEPALTHARSSARRSLALIFWGLPVAERDPYAS